MLILIHSSKTMQEMEDSTGTLTAPLFEARAHRLAEKLKNLDKEELAHYMKLSPRMAAKTYQLVQSYQENQAKTAACDAFIGDVYSGLQAARWDNATRQYAQSHLRILSGLYGVLKPLDRIQPYRLEMGYRLPLGRSKNMYQYWGEDIANALPSDADIVNLLSQEYAKAVIPFIKDRVVITPRFYTQNDKGEPKQVAVHSKIARGAFANWLISTRITSPQDFSNFEKLGYQYDPLSSSELQPTYIANTFGGRGLRARS